MSREKTHSDKDIGKRFLAARKSKGLSQAAFASSIGTVQGQISDIERGAKTPSDTLVFAICYRYAIREQWIMTGNGPMHLGEVREEEKYRAKPNFGLMREVIEAVEEVLQTDNISLSATKKADVITLLCEEIAEDETRRESLGDRALKLVRLAS